MSDITIGATITESTRMDPIVSSAVIAEDAPTPYILETVAPADSGSTEVVLWTSEFHGDLLSTDEAFQSAAVFVDPKNVLEDAENDQILWLKVYTTPEGGGAGAANTYLEAVTRRAPWMRSSCRAGTTTAGGRQITKISVYNSDASNAVPVVCVIA